MRTRLAAGEQNATQLARELREQGMVTSDAAVRRYVAVLRCDSRSNTGDVRDQGSGSDASDAKSTTAAVPAGARSAAPACAPSPRETAWLLRNADAAPDRLTPDEATYGAALCDECPALAAVRVHVKAFADMLSALDGYALAPWLDAADKTELRSFATGIRRDHDAVLAAILFGWSNG